MVTTIVAPPMPADIACASDSSSVMPTAIVVGAPPLVMTLGKVAAMVVKVIRAMKAVHAIAIVNEAAGVVIIIVGVLTAVAATQVLSAEYIRRQQ